jgi:hypothetical protein
MYAGRTKQIGGPRVDNTWLSIHIWHLELGWGLFIFLRTFIQFYVVLNMKNERLSFWRCTRTSMMMMVIIIIVIIIYKIIIIITSSSTINCRSQWPCGLRRGPWPVGCWDCGFESRSRHGCSSASFCVVLSCVGRGLATGWSLVQGVLPYVEIAQETSYMWGGQGPSRTVEPREKSAINTDKNEQWQLILATFLTTGVWFSTSAGILHSATTSRKAHKPTQFLV